MSDPARLWDRTQVVGECLLWTGSVGSHGYGQISFDGRMRTTHRLAYELTCGPIPAGLLVDHICRVKTCIRIDHLRLATKKQNAENIALHGRGSSGVRGVKWDASRNKWAASLCHHGRTINLGRYSSIAEAAEAVRVARLNTFTHNETDRKQA